MRRIEPHQLWIGHAGDSSDVARLRATGIRAIVDLAANELPLTDRLSREMVYCRYPLSDGAKNDRWIVRCALRAIVEFLRAEEPTLVFCSAGMSRSPAMVAGAIAILTGKDAAECLQAVVADGPSDVSHAMWDAVVGAVRELKQ